MSGFRYVRPGFSSYNPPPIKSAYEQMMEGLILKEKTKQAKLQTRQDQFNVDVMDPLRASGMELQNAGRAASLTASTISNASAASKLERESMGLEEVAGFGERVNRMNPAERWDKRWELIDEANGLEMRYGKMASPLHKGLLDYSLKGDMSAYSPVATPQAGSLTRERASGLVDQAFQGGAFNVDPRTRDQIGGSSTVGNRRVSLDYNSSPGARGVEIVIPDNATKEERDAAQDYVNGVRDFYKKHGYDVPVRGVKTKSQNGRGVGGYFHTEPFFIQDQKAAQILRDHGKEYAGVLAGTLGRIPGVTFIAPHKANDGGAQGGGFENERDFARAHILPHLSDIAKGEQQQPDPSDLYGAGAQESQPQSATQYEEAGPPQFGYSSRLEYLRKEREQYAKRGHGKHVTEIDKLIAAEEGKPENFIAQYLPYYDQLTTEAQGVVDRVRAGGPMTELDKLVLKNGSSGIGKTPTPKAQPSISDLNAYQKAIEEVNSSDSKKASTASMIIRSFESKYGDSYNPLVSPNGTVTVSPGSTSITGGGGYKTGLPAGVTEIPASGTAPIATKGNTADEIEGSAAKVVTDPAGPPDGTMSNDAFLIDF